MKWLQKYGFPEDVRLEALRQIRILWAYESTGIEGNTLDFGDTKLVMEEGITIGGKTLREHNEVVGHGRVTDRLETLGQRPLETADVLALHQDMMGGDSGDVMCPNGAWKREENAVLEPRHGSRHVAALRPTARRTGIDGDMGRDGQRSRRQAGCRSLGQAAHGVRERTSVLGRKRPHGSGTRESAQATGRRSALDHQPAATPRLHAGDHHRHGRVTGAGRKVGAVETGMEKRTRWPKWCGRATGPSRKSCTPRKKTHGHDKPGITAPDTVPVSENALAESRSTHGASIADQRPGCLTCSRRHA